MSRLKSSYCLNKALPLLLLFVFIAALLVPALADDQPGVRTTVITMGDSTRTYLHVTAETSYGWFWQRSTGKAYTTSDAAGKQRVKVNELCLTMIAHDTTTQCVEHADSIVITEKKRGVGIPRRTVRLSATTEGPKLGPETMEIRP